MMHGQKNIMFVCVLHVNVFTSILTHLQYNPLSIFAHSGTLFYLYLWWFNILSTALCVHAASDNRTNSD